MFSNSMMLCFLVAVLAASFNSGAQQQYYDSYYKSCNTADSLAYFGKKTISIDTFKLAFESVNFVHAEKYGDAFDVAIDNGDFQSAFEFGKMSIINSGIISFARPRSLKFKRSLYFKQLMDSVEFYLETYNKRVNHSYIKLIDSLFYIDQRIIRKIRSVRGNYTFDQSFLDKSNSEKDSLNWNCLHNLIDSLGFPSQKNVGYKAYRNAVTIIQHNLREKGFEKYHPAIFDAIKMGDYLPTDFAFWYEQYQTVVKGKSYFYSWNGDTSKAAFALINTNRRAFYLKPTSAYKIKRNGLRWKAKW